MANKPAKRTRSTGIAWTDATWNPLRARNRETGDVGWVCVRVSDGCKNCYAATQNKVRRWNRGTGLDYTVPDLTRVETFVDEKTLALPLGWRKPRRVFVCSMTDLFGEWVTDDEIDRVFAVMALTPQHEYQVLTKRPERMRTWVSTSDDDGGLSREDLIDMASMSWARPGEGLWEWPLLNVWLGVSAENQEAFDERYPHLRRTPAAVTFASYEPALGPLDIHHAQPSCYCGDYLSQHHNGVCFCGCREWREREPGLSWLIVGGESGPGWRPMQHEWVASIRDQCAAAGTVFFGKQDSGARSGLALPPPLNEQKWPTP